MRGGERGRDRVRGRERKEGDKHETQGVNARRVHKKTTVALFVKLKLTTL